MTNGFRWKALQRPEYLGHQRHQVFDPVAYSFDHHNGNGQGRKVLLEFKISIHDEKRVKLRCSQGKQFPVPRS